MEFKRVFGKNNSQPYSLPVRFIDSKTKVLERNTSQKIEPDLFDNKVKGYNYLPYIQEPIKFVEKKMIQPIMPPRTFISTKVLPY